jgi:Cys-rich repeat protein
MYLEGRALNMKKQFIIPLFFCVAATLLWVASGFSFGVYSDGCGDCHGDNSVVHPQHGVGQEGGVDCSACHMQDPPESPDTSTCIVCHPGNDPGLCPLVFDHANATSCLGCHVSDCGEAECDNDTDCDDGLFCNGIESCSTEGSVTVCVDGEPPCTGDTPACIEETETCVECVLDADCAEGEICEANVCIVDDTCPPDTPPEVLIYDEDGDCLLNKEELKIYKDTLKDDQKEEKTTLKDKQKAEKDQYKLIKKEFSTK